MSSSGSHLVSHSFRTLSPFLKYAHNSKHCSHCLSHPQIESIKRKFIPNSSEGSKEEWVNPQRSRGWISFGEVPTSSSSYPVLIQTARVDWGRADREELRLHWAPGKPSVELCLHTTEEKREGRKDFWGSSRWKFLLPAFQRSLRIIQLFLAEPSWGDFTTVFPENLRAHLYKFGDFSFLVWTATVFERWWNAFISLGLKGDVERRQ